MEITLEPGDNPSPFLLDFPIVERSIVHMHFFYLLLSKTDSMSYAFFPFRMNKSFHFTLLTMNSGFLFMVYSLHLYVYAVSLINDIETCLNFFVGLAFG